jgi:hypothetical protein
LSENETPEVSKSPSNQIPNPMNTCKTRKNKNKVLKKSDSSTVQQLLNNVYLFGEEDFLYFYSNITHLNNNLSNQFNYRVAPIFWESLHYSYFFCFSSICYS